MLFSDYQVNAICVTTFVTVILYCWMSYDYSDSDDDDED
jgi:hypothetical protein